MFGGVCCLVFDVLVRDVFKEGTEHAKVAAVAQLARGVDKVSRTWTYRDSP